MVTRDPLEANRPRAATRRAETHRHDEEASIVVILFVCVQKMDRSDGTCPSGPPEKSSPSESSVRLPLFDETG